MFSKGNLSPDGSRSFFSLRSPPSKEEVTDRGDAGTQQGGCPLFHR